ncbi:MAG: hypothetical protein WC444_04295 [Candidatus Paceibacterota bacterium]
MESLTEIEELDEKLWKEYLGGLEKAKAEKMIRNFRVFDYEKRIVEIQPYFSVRPLIRVSWTTEEITK